MIIFIQITLLILAIWLLIGLELEKRRMKKLKKQNQIEKETKKLLKEKEIKLIEEEELRLIGEKYNIDLTK